MTTSTTPSRTVEAVPGGRARLAVPIAGVGALVVMLDSAVNIAFPAISAAFGVPVTAIQGVVIAYMLAFAASLLPAGRLADRLGAAGAFAIGLAVLGVALLLGGVAATYGGLLAARVLQGVGAGLVFGSAPALVTLATPEARRGRALGWFSLAASLGMVLGPLLGGVLVAAWGWRAVYLARVPLAVGVLLVALRRLPGGAGARRLGAARADAPLAGARADRRALVLANAANLLANAALFSVWLLVPYYLLERRGLGAGWGGALFAASPLAWAVATPLGGWLADRGGRRWLPPVALAVEALGLLLTSRLDGASPAGAIALALGLAGGGFGLFVVPNMHYVMGALPPARQGTAGGLVTLMRTAGVVLGASLATLVYDRRLGAYGAAGLPAPAAGAFADAFRVTAGVAATAVLVSLVPGRRGAG